MSKVIFLNRTDGTKDPAIFCPACDCYHVFDSRWTFNGDVDKPTFSPSMCVNCVDEKYLNEQTVRCHSFVRNGQIQYLGDCTHDMKNQTIELPNADM